MAIVKLLEKHEMDPAVSEILDQVEKLYGFTPNILKALANCPQLLTTFVPFWGGIYVSDAIGPRYRALAALGTAKAHDCQYCIAHMSVTARKAGLTEAEIDAAGRPDDNRTLDERERCIVEYASTLTKDSGGVTDELLQKMKNCFTDAELVNLTMVIGLYNLTGRFLKALRIDIEDVFDSSEIKQAFGS